MLGRSPRGTNAACLTQVLSVTSFSTHKQISPFWCWFLCGWFCVLSRTLCVSPMDPPVSLGVFLPTQHAQVFSVRGFEHLFPHFGTPVCADCLAPQVFLPVYPHTKVGPPAPPVAASPAPPAATPLAPVVQPKLSCDYHPLRLHVSAPPPCGGGAWEELWFTCSAVAHFPTNPPVSLRVSPTMANPKILQSALSLGFILASPSHIVLHLTMVCLSQPCPCNPKPHFVLSLSIHLTGLVGLVDCFFNLLVVGFPCSLIFWYFWLFIDVRLVVILLLLVCRSEGFLPTPPSGQNVHLVLSCFFLRFYFFYFRGEGRKRGRETSMCGGLSHTPWWGLDLKSRHNYSFSFKPTSCQIVHALSVLLHSTLFHWYYKDLSDVHCPHKGLSIHVVFTQILSL